VDEKAEHHGENQTGYFEHKNGELKMESAGVDCGSNIFGL